jgi:hypothetical protein
VRRVPIVAVCLFLVVGVSIARGSSATFPVSDEAVTELATLNALQGGQRLGPYSRYAWHHPGPALFYLLAPFYAAGGRQTAALSSGALAISVSALALIAWVLYRRGGPVAAAIFAILAFVYLRRLGELLVSPWNAHAAVLPAAAVVVLGAAVAAGDVIWLPALVLLASFAVQTHIATLPLVACVFGSLLLVRLPPSCLRRFRLRQGYGETHGSQVDSRAKAVGASRRSSLEPTASAGGKADTTYGMARTTPGPTYRLVWWLTAAVLVLMWAIPVLEELTSKPGNLTHLWQFAIAPGGSAAPAVAFEAWADTMTVPLRAAASLPRGLLLTHDGPGWIGLMAIAELAGLTAAAVWARRRARPFHVWLAVQVLLVSVAGLLMATRIPDGIHDHEMFWMSAVGLLNVTAIAASFAFRPEGRRRLMVSAAAVTTLLIGGVAVTAVLELKRLADRSHVTTRADARIERATHAVEAEITRTGSSRPKILIDQRVWEPAAGVILQLRKKGAAVAVQPGLERMLSGTEAANGTEDLEITFCGGPCHEGLIARPGNNVVLFGDGLAIDAIELDPPGR